MFLVVEVMPRFDMEEYKKVDQMLLAVSQRLGVPELTEDAIKAHGVALVEQVKEVELMYVKKFLGSTYRVPKKPKQKSQPVPVSIKVAAVATEVVATPSFQDLAKPKTSMDDWKCAFCNNSINEAMKSFYEMLDRDEFSVWHGTYKYNDENTKLFMTKNLLLGFKGQCDVVSKYIFGQANIMEKEGKYAIELCLLIRGKDITLFNNAVEDGEYYSWRQVDVDRETDFLKEAWTNVGAAASLPLF